MKLPALAVLLPTVLLLALPGCEQRMANQRRLETLERVAGQSLPPGREEVPGSVARPADQHPVNEPERYTRDDLLAGQKHFEAYCAPCHGLAGEGDGMVVQRGFPAPPSFHEARLRRLSIAAIYQVITHGSGMMYPYANRLFPVQRWQTAAYVKVLQRAQYVPADTLTDAQRARLSATPTGGAAP